MPGITRREWIQSAGSGIAACALSPLLRADSSLTTQGLRRAIVSQPNPLVVVPAGTPDDQIFEAAQNLGGELVLENGMRFSFTLEDAAVGAQFSASRNQEDDTHVGLSSLPDVPSGT